MSGEGEPTGGGGAALLGTPPIRTAVTVEETGSTHVQLRFGAPQPPPELHTSPEPEPEQSSPSPSPVPSPPPEPPQPQSLVQPPQPWPDAESKPEPHDAEHRADETDHLVSSDLGEHAECAICLAQMCRPTAFPNPQCPHRYCADCLDELLEHGNSCEPPKMVLCPQCRRPAPWTAPDPPSLGFLLDDDGGAASIAAARRSRRCCLLAVVCVVALSSALSWWSVSIITQQFGL
jgi:hypothetical protein